MNHSARPLYRLLISITTPALLIALTAEPATAQRSRSSVYGGRAGSRKGRGP